MTVASAIRYINYNGSGTTGPFSFNFRILIEDDGTPDISVVKNVGGVRTELSYPGDYSFVAASLGLGGGSITLAADLEVGERLTISGSTPIDQIVEYRNQGPYDAETHEGSYDKLTLIVQEQQDALNRSVKLPTDSVVAVAPYLDTPVAGAILQYNADASAIVAGPNGYNLLGDGTVSAPGLSFLAETSTGMYRPATRSMGLVAAAGIIALFTGVASPDNYIAFTNSAAASVAYNVIASTGGSAAVGMTIDTKGTTTTGGQFYGNKYASNTETSGRVNVTIAGVRVAAFTDTYWNPNISYGGAPEGYLVFSSGKDTGAMTTDMIAGVISVESTIYDGVTVDGLTIMIAAKGVTGSIHQYTNGYLSFNVSGGTNPNGNDQYILSNYINVGGTAAGTGINCSMSVQAGADPSLPHMTFYTTGAGNFSFLADNIATPLFRMYRTASAVNSVYSKAAVAGGFAYLGAEGQTNSGLALTSNGSGDVRTYTNAMGALQLVVAHTASAVNAISITGGATGNNPTITVGGPSVDANRGLTISTHGTGNSNVSFYDGGAIQAQIGGGSTSTSYLTLGGGPSSTVISAQNGFGSNVSLTIYTGSGTGSISIKTNNTATPVMDFQSTGRIKFTNSASFQANATNTVTISNLAPAAVTTATIKKWLRVNDDTGTDLYIPAWGA